MISTRVSLTFKIAQNINHCQNLSITYYDDMLITPKLTPWPKFSFPPKKTPIKKLYVEFTHINKQMKSVF